MKPHTEFVHSVASYVQRRRSPNQDYGQFFWENREVLSPFKPAQFTDVTQFLDSLFQTYEDLDPQELFGNRWHPALTFAVLMPNVHSATSGKLEVQELSHSRVISSFLAEEVMQDYLDDYFLEILESVLWPFLAGECGKRIRPPSFTPIDDDDDPNPEHYFMTFKVALLWDTVSTPSASTERGESRDHTLSPTDPCMILRGGNLSPEQACAVALRAQMDDEDDRLNSEIGVRRRVVSSVFPRFLGFLVAYDGLTHDENEEGMFTWSYNDIVPCNDWIADLVKNMNSQQTLMQPIHAGFEYAVRPPDGSYYWSDRQIVNICSPYSLNKDRGGPGLGQSADVESRNYRFLLKHSRWAVTQCALLNRNFQLSWALGVMTGRCCDYQLMDDYSSDSESHLMLTRWESQCVKELMRLLIDFYLHWRPAAVAVKLVAELERMQRTHWEFEQRSGFRPKTLSFVTRVHEPTLLNVAIANARQRRAQALDLERRKELKALCSGKPGDMTISRDELCLITELIYDSINNKIK